MSSLGPIRAITGLAADVAVQPPNVVEQALMPTASILSRAALRGDVSAAAFDEAMSQVREIGTGLAQRVAQQAGVMTVDQRAQTTEQLRSVLKAVGLDLPGVRPPSVPGDTPAGPAAAPPPPAAAPSGAFTYDRSGARPAPPAGGT